MAAVYVMSRTEDDYVSVMPSHVVFTRELSEAEEEELMELPAWMTYRPSKKEEKGAA